MTVEAPQMYCRLCWNPVERIQYRAEGKVIGGGDIQNVWKHSAPLTHPPACSKNPIMDDDVISEEELP